MFCQPLHGAGAVILGIGDSRQTRISDVHVVMLLSADSLGVVSQVPAQLLGGIPQCCRDLLQLCLVFLQACLVDHGSQGWLCCYEFLKPVLKAFLLRYHSADLLPNTFGQLLGLHAGVHHQHRYKSQLVNSILQHGLDLQAAVVANWGDLQALHTVCQRMDGMGMRSIPAARAHM